VEFDPELTEFVGRHIRSVWTLETLMLLRRDPTRHWTIDQLVGELRASRMLLEEVLSALGRLGAVQETDGAIAYIAKNGPIESVAARLEAHYRERPVALINLISRPRDPVQRLADAFRFRGGGP
jgi:hypothetical protein